MSAVGCSAAARTLIEATRLDLQWVGVTPPSSQTSADALRDLDEIVTSSLLLLHREGRNSLP